ncbi:MAG: YggT family protein [Cyanobacteria bacterium SIG30]|nr:YggT family protein [Cyanobacteria bacterium SIG30]
MISYAITQVFNLIYLILIVSVLFSWIPSINYAKQPFKAIREFSELFFKPFRAIIPPIGGMLDISPIVCFLFLQLLQYGLLMLFNSIGM